MADSKKEVVGFQDKDIPLCRDSMGEFSRTSGAGKGDPNTLNSKACGKMVKDCLPKEVVTIADASVFPKYKEKGKQHINLKNDDAIKGFVCDLAYEFAKIKLKKPKLQKDDDCVKCYEQEFADRITKGKPILKEVKTSTTGNVKGMTDTKHYTGAHKERFDECGKGKGASGRTDKVENKGYVGNYKGEGSYGKK